MDKKTYERTTEKELVGKKVKSLHVLSNAMAVLPAGTIFTIQHKFKGLELLSEPCPHCGVQVRISKVRPYWVEMVVPAFSIRGVKFGEG